MTLADNIAAFEAQIKDWGICYADWAGGERVYASDRDIAGSGLYPDSGDWLVYDARCRSGMIGVSHDNFSDIRPIKLKSAKKFGVNLRQKIIPHRVSTIELMRRYLWITSVFIDWLHVDGASPLDHWSNPQAIHDAFTTEKPEFANDPHLALYWLIHFGLCHDPRYADVAAAIRAHEHPHTLKIIQPALSFFDHTDIHHDIDLTPRYNPSDGDYSRLFLRRRANLLYLTYSQSYRGEGWIAPLWPSISLYRDGDPFAIRRMRWFKNNLLKYDLWPVFQDRLNDPDSDNIPYIHYVRCFQPERNDTGKCADTLAQEILETRMLWRNHSGNWAKEILWDIRTQVGDKSAYYAVVKTVFAGDQANPRFTDICHALGEPASNTPQNLTAQHEFDALFTDIANLCLLPQEQINRILLQADALLASLSAPTLDFLIDAVTNHDARRVLLRFCLLNRRENQQAHLTRLFSRTFIPDYEFKHFFHDQTPAILTDSHDPVFRAFLTVLSWPESAHENTGTQSGAPKSVCALLRPSAHNPEIFHCLMVQIETSKPIAFPGLLFEHIFKHRYHATDNPVEKLNRAQIERLLNACLAHICQHPNDFRKALSVIESCANRNATDWFTEKLLDDAALWPLKNHPGHYDPLDEELTDAFCGFFRPIAHEPAIFDRLLSRIESGTQPQLSNRLFANLFQATYAEDKQRLLQLNRAQIERLLNACLTHIYQQPDHSQEALRVIEECSHPEAGDWIRGKLSDETVFQPLEGYYRNCPLSEELKEALQVAWEEIHFSQ